ncbi:PREDICTED: uncharacterized protein LOC106741877 [Dinoponera quadriceps]|uniref:Uncharacterized protein LOC106741877 n=1 Tax=Dinoponera quadriceps TaxID=609295 RepID=A0A6P3WUD6_DINQU|nr:PREDICTED: uncharacterized protein LOC106741877 [Dinoponera quadriceps]
MTISRELIIILRLLLRPASLPLLITCSRHERLKYIERCLKSSIESMKHYLMDDIPNLDLPSFEPYWLEHYQFVSSEQFNGIADLTGITVHNLTNFTINKVEVNTNVTWIKLEAFFPSIQFFATYDIQATIFGKYLRKRGRTVIGNFRGVSINVTIEGEYRVRPKNKEEHFKVTNVPVKLSINEATFYLNNNKVHNLLIQEINSLLASNRKIVAKKLVPELQKFASKIIRRIAVNMYSNIPMRLLMRDYNFGDDEDIELSIIDN